MPLIEEGKKAPAFTLPDQDGEKHALKDYAGRPIVLYFYPKDDTSGCTAEACAFRDLLPKFETSEAVIFGVSPDDVDSHAKFAAKYDLNFTLLADVPEKSGTPKVCDTYGVWHEKSMYGRKYMGVARTTYLIDADGKVARRWDSVKVPGHADEVLAAINVLK
jgi:thioredoxin-dependent peroxiredoxin